MPTTTEDTDRARAWLIAAIQRTIHQDRYLWDVYASERARVARVHHYLATAVEAESDWDVDCEFNRNHTDLKRYRDDDNNKRYGVPDIIIHKRGTPENLLIVEFKQTWPDIREGRDDDRKMRAWLSALGYPLGALVAFGPTPQRRRPQPPTPQIAWRRAGGREPLETLSE